MLDSLIPGPRTGDDTPTAAMNAGYAGWKVVFPRSPAHWSNQPVLQEIEAVSPFPIVREGLQENDSVLVVMLSGAALETARELKTAGLRVVIWAWRCAEIFAHRAENQFPVVYGVPTLMEVEEAEIGYTAETKLLSETERLFGFPEEIIL